MVTDLVCQDLAGRAHPETTQTFREGINIMTRAIRNILVAAAIGATSGTAQVPPEVAENRCEGKPRKVACWQKLANRPECYFWTDDSRPEWIVTWTGECVKGLAQGMGTLEWTLSDGYLIGKSTGNLKDGKYHGKWELDHTYGPSAGYYDATGSYVEGVRHGPWYEYYGKGFSAEGSYVDGKRHGLWTEYGDDRFPHIGREVAKGPYLEGKKHGLWTITETRTMENPEDGGEELEEPEITRREVQYVQGERIESLFEFAEAAFSAKAYEAALEAVRKYLASADSNHADYRKALKLREAIQEKVRK